MPHALDALKVLGLVIGAIGTVTTAGIGWLDLRQPEKGQSRSDRRRKQRRARRAALVALVVAVAGFGLGLTIELEQQAQEAQQLKRMVAAFLAVLTPMETVSLEIEATVDLSGVPVSDYREELLADALALRERGAQVGDSEGVVHVNQSNRQGPSIFEVPFSYRMWPTPDERRGFHALPPRIAVFIAADSLRDLAGVADSTADLTLIAGEGRSKLVFTDEDEPLTLSLASLHADMPKAYWHPSGRLRSLSQLEGAQGVVYQPRIFNGPFGGPKWEATTLTSMRLVINGQVVALGKNELHRVLTRNGLVYTFRFPRVPLPILELAQE